MKKQCVGLLVCLLLLLNNSILLAAGEKIAWFKSGADSRFWPVVEQIMLSAAADLGIELTIYEFKNDPFYMLSVLKEVVENEQTRPDCILTHNYKKKGEEFIKMAGESSVPIFIFNAGFSEAEDVGEPRGKHPNWIGQILPDDEHGGYLLAKKLIEKAKLLEKNSSGTIGLVAFEGNRASDASNKRVAGLKRALAEHPEVRVNQYFHVKWKMARAGEAYKTAMQRYPDTTIFWSASEDMAIGAIKAARESGAVPGEDFVTGGFDLIPDNKGYIESGEMAVSIGAHYFEGAWALILIQDYLRGIDFAKDEGMFFTTKMASQTQSDFNTFSDIFTILSGPLLDKLDFTTLSKSHNPERTKYDFSIPSFLEQVGNE